MVFATLFIFGLLVGSFLNVVIFRIERNESFVAGRSRCLACNHQLRWYDNIPLVSFLQIRGRCRYCKTTLSLQYPLVEVLTAFLFASITVLSPWLMGKEGLLFGGYLLATISIMVVIGVYDIRFLKIPTVFLWALNGLLIACFVALLYWYPSSILLPSLSSAFFGAVAVGGFLAALVLVSKETWMGQADIWIGTWAGMLLGIELAQIFLTLSFTLGAVMVLVLGCIKRGKFTGAVPFAPYLLVSGVLLFGCIFLAPEVLEFLSPWFLDRIEG